ncbi:hypothetical protein LCGC14_1302530 [marine sediment metagenome]|uniref:DUF5658 domain-containing protein n=1 Tax=marine sediment metagenome TaxID=412755 RepID=A0A0F9N5R6_9ZZZZ
MIQWLLYIALFFYCMVDFYQTKLLLELGAYEMNPLLRWMAGITGTWFSVAIFKVGLLTVLGVFLLKRNRRVDDIIPRGT